MCTCGQDYCLTKQFKAHLQPAASPALLIRTFICFSVNVALFVSRLVCTVGILTACISIISLWYLMMVLLSFSFSVLSSSCSFLFSFSFLCTSVSVPLWPPRAVVLRFITSASLLTAWEQSKAARLYRDLQLMNLNSANPPHSLQEHHRCCKTDP